MSMVVFLAFEDNAEGEKFLTAVQKHKVVARPVLARGKHIWRKNKVAVVYRSGIEEDKQR
jgi:hypothetical protein